MRRQVRGARRTAPSPSRTRCSGQIGSSENQAATALRTPRSPAATTSGRPRQRARNHSAVHRPMPGSSVSRAITSSFAEPVEPGQVGVGQRQDRADLRSRELQPLEIAAAHVGLARERPPLESVVLDPPAVPPIRPLRITHAARSEICCAVTEWPASRTGRRAAAAEAGERAATSGHARAKPSTSNGRAQQVAELGQVGRRWLAPRARRRPR